MPGGRGPRPWPPSSRGTRISGRSSKRSTGGGPRCWAAPIDGTADLLLELRTAGVRLYALSNWSAETFPIARRRFPFLERFDGIVISGDVGLIKPDPRIFEHLVARYAIEPGESVFIDDSAVNVEAAGRLGFVALRFVDARQLRYDLEELGLLRRARSAATR